MSHCFPGRIGLASSERVSLALERSRHEDAHHCPLPWPIDPEVPEGHVCECGRRWVYQPARWEPLYSVEELRLKQATGAFVRAIVPTLGPKFRESHDGLEPPAIVPIR